MAVCKLFDERPVWPKQSLYERLHDDGMHVSQNQFRRLNFIPFTCRVASTFTSLGISFNCYFTCYLLPFHYMLRLLFRAGYYFSTGPFGKFWIRRGYDPRRDTESRM
jgi:general transcription factor 3C polypeptide 5 (transcription factor C subunit 1)